MSISKRGKSKKPKLISADRLRVRTYLPSDADKVVELTEALRAEDPTFPMLDSARWRYVCADAHAQPEETFHVLESDEGEILGVAYRLDPPRVEGGRYRAVFAAVAPDYRRQGFGRALFEATVGADVPKSSDPDWFLSTTLDEASEVGAAFVKSMGLKKSFTRYLLERPLPGRPLPDFDSSELFVQDFVGSSAYADWAQIHNLAYASQRDAEHLDSALLQQFRPAGFRPEHVRFARKEKQRIGYLFMRESGEGGHIESIGVLPEARGQGVATMLTLDAIRYLTERGHQVVNLVVDAENKPALQLYARLGFEEAGRRIHYQRGARRARKKATKAK